MKYTSTVAIQAFSVCFVLVALLRVMTMDIFTDFEKISRSSVDDSIFSAFPSNIEKLKLDLAAPPLSAAMCAAAYIPGKLSFVREVRHMIHPSWHVGARRHGEMAWLRHGEIDNDAQDFSKHARARLDLLLFVDPSVIHLMPPDCLRVDELIEQSELKSKKRKSKQDDIKKSLKLVFNDTDEKAGERIRSFIKTHTTGPGGTCYIIGCEISSNQWENLSYNFMNSIYFLNAKRFKPLLRSYELVVRTDSDVFLSPRLWHFRLTNPNEFVVGRGWYGMEYTFNRLRKVAKRMALTDRGLINLGSTWIGTPDQVIAVSALTNLVAAELLRTEFEHLKNGTSAENKKIHAPGTTIDGKLLRWPYWHRGVVLLYSAQIAINHLIKAEYVKIENKRIDVPSNRNVALSKVWHIHCWLFQKKFDKTNYTNYKAEEYSNFHELEPTSNPVLSDFAVYIAVYYSVATSGIFPFKG